MIIFKHDSRDKIYQQKFGQALDIPDEFNFDSNLYDNVQPLGDVKCTCYTTCDIAEDQDKREYDIIDLWSRISKDQHGADPREPLSEAVANGLLPINSTERIKNWKSYWRADVGDKDPFDNVISSLWLAQSPVGVGTYWHAEWLVVPQSGILPMGKTQMNGHMYSVEGVKIINGVKYLIVEAWLGKKLYMSREVFNEAMKPYGMQAWVLSTSEIDVKRKKSLLEKIRDLCINVIILLKQKLVLENPQAVKDTITKMEPIKTPTDVLLETVESFIGKDASPDNKAPQDLSCAEGASNIINKAFSNFPKGILSTVDLQKELKRQPMFKATLTPKRGCIINSPRIGDTPGHVGFMVSDTEIVSNDSKTGTMKKNYTWLSWIKEMRDKRGLKIHLFELA